MMNSIGWNGGFFFLFWAFHMLGILIGGIGIAFLLFWAFKHFSEAKLCKWGWVLVVVGAVLCVLAFASIPLQAGGSPMGFGGMMPMMFYGDEESSKSVSQATEEAQGKALYDALASKSKTCADLSDADFELIGEYAMGLSMGTSHERMNAMMQRMMGKEGEERMHARMGKLTTGCAGDSVPGFRMPMMQNSLPPTP